MSNILRGLGGYLLVTEAYWNLESWDHELRRFKMKTEKVTFKAKGKRFQEFFTFRKKESSVRDCFSRPPFEQGQ